MKQVTLSKCTYLDIINFTINEFGYSNDEAIKILYGDGDGPLEDHKQCEIELGSVLDGYDLREYYPNIEEMDYDDIDWQLVGKYIIHEAGTEDIKSKHSFEQYQIIITHFMMKHNSTHILVDCRR